MSAHNTGHWLSTLETVYPLSGVVAQWLERWCVSLVWHGSSVVGALVCIPCVAWWLSGWSAGVYPLCGMVAQWLERWCVSLVWHGSSVVGALVCIPCVAW